MNVETTEERIEAIPMPEQPGELWMLWGERGWVKSIDDATDGQTYLVSFSYDEALAASRHQDDSYGIPCIPVRVK